MFHRLWMAGKAIGFDLAIFVIDEASSITLPRAHKSAGRFDGYGDAALVERVRGLLSDVVDRLMEATGATRRCDFVV